MATEDDLLKPEIGTELCRVKTGDCSFGGYKNEILVENLSDRERGTYSCPRCKGIMKDASLTNKGDPLCVWCRNENEQPIPNAQVRDIILSLKCACPLSKRGCEWLGMLESVEDHLTTCGYVHDSCQLSCGAVLTRDELINHMSKCIERGEKCEHCEEVYKVCEMLEHVRVCSKVLVMCERGCGSHLSREEMAFHKESECNQNSVNNQLGKPRSKTVTTGYLHIDMRLDALEEQNWKLSKRVETLESEMRIKNRENDMLNEKVEMLEDICVRTSFTVKWTIQDVIDKSNRRKTSLSFSEEHEIAGYRFQLKHLTENQVLYVDFSFIKGTSTDLLEWPFRAYFMTRLICHRDRKDSLLFKSPIVVIQKGEYRFSILSHKQIATIPLTTNLKDFLKLNCLNLEITGLILRAK